MTEVRILIGPDEFKAKFCNRDAPVSCRWLEALMPLRRRILHARWSGEACWAPLGGVEMPLMPENATCYPRPGEILLYAGGLSEPELLMPYGPTHFTSKAGPLAGNPVLRVEAGLERLASVCRDISWTGARDLLLERVSTQ